MVNCRQKAYNECIEKVTDKRDVKNEIISGDTNEEEEEEGESIGHGILESLMILQSCS